MVGPARRERRRLYLFCALLVGTFLLLDVMRGAQPPDGLPRLLLVATFLTAAALARSPSERVQRNVSLLIGSVPTAFFLQMVWQTGGTRGVAFPWAVALPLAGAALFQHDLRAPLAGAVITLVGSVVTFLLEGRSTHDLLHWLTMYFSACAMAGYACFSFRRVRRAELAHARSSAEALGQLALSERRRTQTERLAVVGQLAAGVAHEINNPLAYVKSNVTFLRTEVLGERQAPPQELREAFEEAGMGIERIRQIVTDLKSFSREDAGEVEEVALEELVQEALRLSSARLKAAGSVTPEIGAQLPRVRANRRQLSQVLVNLLINAADAVEESAPTAPRIKVQVRQHAEGVQLAVEDNGPGLPEPILGRLFEPFFTTKPPGKGTGLGLALSREFVERFGGTLRAENRPEGGARFIVELKIASNLETQDPPGPGINTPGA
jgi:signal transduction histidine kinase